MQMERSVLKKDRSGNSTCLEDRIPTEIADVVRSVLLLLGNTARSFIKTETNDLVIEVMMDSSGNLHQGVHHSFFDTRYVDEIVARLKMSLSLRSRTFGVLEDRAISDFMYNFMPRFLDSPENDVEKKLKAVLAVIYGGARKQEEIERLVALNWKDLLAVIYIVRHEYQGAYSAIDVLDLTMMSA